MQRNIKMEAGPSGHMLELPKVQQGKTTVRVFGLSTAELIDLARQALLAVGTDMDDVEEVCERAQAQHDSADSAQEQRYDG